MFHNISKESFGFIIIGTKASQEDWAPILQKFEEKLIAANILIPIREKVFKSIEYYDSISGNGKDIVIIIDEENLKEANYPFLCKLCMKPNPQFMDIFTMNQKLPIYWLRDILNTQGE